MKVKDDVDILKWIRIVEEEINVKSDRAMVVTSASILDSQLEMLLRAFMISDDKIDERLFNANGALATFSSKNSMCYYLGIISEYEYKTIETIRKIRNRFAHEIEIKKMSDDQSIINLCNNLTLSKEMYMPEIIKIENGCIEDFDVDPLKNTDIQTKFIRVFKNLTMYLDYRIVETSEVKRKKYKNLSFLQLLKDSKTRLIDLNEERYRLNTERKQKLLLEIEKVGAHESKKIEEMKNDIQNIEKEIRAYKEGDLFYGCTAKPDGSSQTYMKFLDKVIELFEKKN